MRVDVNWVEARQFGATNEEGAQFRMDAKKKSGGSGDYCSPTDHLLAAVGGCTGIDVVSILQKMRQEFRSLRIEVDGTQAEEYPKYFTKIHLKYIVEGDNIDSDKVRQAVELSQNKYCSVSATLADKCEVTTEIEINP
jgi:putative redox protein